jgi:hypothetical protein
MGQFDGVYPGDKDIIITGRSFEEAPVTRKMLASKGIANKVFFNPLRFEEKTRESSGEHKARVISDLFQQGVHVNIHFEDDPIQAEIIKKSVPQVHVVLLVHDLVEKENVWHESDL